MTSNVSHCLACPIECGANRSKTNGFCQAGEKMKIARAALHLWEEPFLVGQNGSGTIFFSGCNLKCLFCQNFEISQENFGLEATVDNLTEIITMLQDKGASNINLVNPSHFSDQIVSTLEKVKPKLHIPVVFNTSSFDKVETLKKFEGLVDIYLADVKFFDQSIAEKFCSQKNYFTVASKAIVEMRRQQPEDVFQSRQMEKGVVFRHLVLPTLTDQSKKIIEFLEQNFGKEIFISIMCQYFPAYKAKSTPPIDRCLTEREYLRVVDFAERLGLQNMLLQEFVSNPMEYVPCFDLTGLKCN